MDLVFIALLIAVLLVEALFSAYFGRDRFRPKWMRWLNGGIILLVIAFSLVVIRQALSLIRL